MPPSHRSKEEFEEIRDNLQKLNLKCHRSKTIQERTGNLVSDAVRGNDQDVRARRDRCQIEQLQLLNSYKLAWKKCPACGDAFDPKFPNHIDLHHVGELEGIFLIDEDVCLVPGKDYSLSKMPNMKRVLFSSDCHCQ